MKTFSLIDELRYYAFLHFWCHLISKWIRARSTTLSTTTLTALRSSAVLPENMLLRPKRSAFQRLFPIIRKNSGLPCVFATGWRRFAASFPDYVLRGRTAASDPWNIHEHSWFRLTNEWCSAYRSCSSARGRRKQLRPGASRLQRLSNPWELSSKVLCWLPLLP